MGADGVLAIILVWVAIAVINVLEYAYDRPPPLLTARGTTALSARR